MPSLPRLPLLATVAGLFLAVPAAAAACPAADVQPSGANAVVVRAAIVCETNAQRAVAGLPALAAEGRLESAAQGFAQRMVAERFFSHVGPDGSQLSARLAAYADWTMIGENIAWGEGELATPRNTVAAWMRSPSHRANLLSADFSEVGIGVASGSPVGSTGPAATYVADYGRRTTGAPGLPVEGAAAARTAPEVARAVPRPASGTRSASVPRRCRRGTVRRVLRVRGRHVVRCAPARRRAAAATRS